MYQQTRITCNARAPASTGLPDQKEWLLADSINVDGTRHGSPQRAHRDDSKHKGGSRLEIIRAL